MKLPPDINEKIEQAYRTGVTLAVDLELENVTGIVWTRQFLPSIPPADHNGLAEAILKYVGDDELALEIDGHKYLIRKADE